jgi:ATP-binding cassette subfamily B protein
MVPPHASLLSFAAAPSRHFAAIRRILPFVLRYRMHIIGATLALLAATVTVLRLGQGLRRLVDDGFRPGDPAPLDRAALGLIGVVVLLAGSTFCRFYLVSRVAERRCRRYPARRVRSRDDAEPGLFRDPPYW